ncbi:MAG: single-stranded-DNA-specific exonuclease RecJ [Candidatus Pacebacteria bacterium]|nr:single-stranded-DNA-specific exonuclease RecJ [Candidatus Paceibacterota bacterium]MBP9843085.1 single-stranded-DNA-specific exonuclease RecJ [Candidatus Paceibacterota bacterium]
MWEMVPYEVLFMATYRFPEGETTIIAPTLSELTNRLLARRGVTAEEMSSFLSPNYEAELHDPFLLHDMEKAVTRLLGAMEKKETIAIFSDYDCDGIPGAVVLHDLLVALQYPHFKNYIPHRHYEGFGLNKNAIDTLASEGVKLIITIDCGTSDIEAVTHANSKGVDVIITDHHEPHEILPEALAIINPKLGTYPFTELCGAAVAFKLAQAVLARTAHTLSAGQEKWWLDMVGIATIADMVPLKGENRIFAHFGLQVLRKSRRPGLQKLLSKNRIDQRYLTEEDIGFTIGPRINAASRMDNPEHAFHMLRATDVGEATTYVDHLEKLNKERKTMVATMTKDLHKRLEHLEEIPAVLVLGNPEWRPSLVGLAANKLAEEHKRPVFLWGKDGNGVLKGSCRSGGGVSVVRIMNEASEAFLEHGGHHFSGGFSVKDEHIFTLSERLNDALASLKETATIDDIVEIDAVLSLDAITSEFMRELRLLAPFGTGNPKPIFAFTDVTPRKVEQFGKAEEHLKLTFETGTGSLEAIAFFTKAEDFQKHPAIEPLTLVAHVEQSYFMGRSQLRLRIIDIV